MSPPLNKPFNYGKKRIYINWPLKIRDVSMKENREKKKINLERI